MNLPVPGFASWFLFVVRSKAFSCLKLADNWFFGRCELRDVLRGESQPMAFHASRYVDTEAPGFAMAQADSNGHVRLSRGAFKIGRRL